MKALNLFGNIFNGKAKVLGMLGGLVVAGAALTAGAPAANAQVAFGVAIGGPRYYAPAPRPYYRPYAYVAPGYVAPGYVAPGYVGGYAPGYWDHRRYEDWRAHEYVEHHEGRFHGGYGWR